MNRGLRADVAALAARSFLIMFVNGLSMMLFPIHFSTLGYGLARTGGLVALANVGSMAVSLAAGYAVERADRRRALLLGSCLLAVVYSLYLFVRTDLGLGLLRTAHGLITPLASVAGLVLIADVGGDARGRVAAVVTQWGSIGMIAGPLAGGLIMARLGINSAFLLSAAAVLLGGVVVFVAARPTRPAAPAPRAIGGLKSPRAYMLLGINLLDFIGFQAWVLLLVVLLQSRGVPATVIGTMITIQTAAYAAAQRTCGKVADRGRGILWVMVGSLLYGAAVYGMYLVQGQWALGAVMAAAGLVAAPTFAAVFVELSGQAGPDTSRAMGMLTASTGLGNTVGPLLGGLLGSISLGAGFVAAVGILWANAGLAALYLVSGRRRR